MSLSARAARSQAKPSGFGIFVRILLEHLKLKKAWPSSPSGFGAFHEHVEFDGQFFGSKLKLYSIEATVVNTTTNTWLCLLMDNSLVDNSLFFSRLCCVCVILYADI
jgi:hypothetical protein